MVKGINPLRYSEDSEENTGWMAIVQQYFIPGMIVLAIIGVMVIQLDGSLGGGDGGNSIFYDMGKVMFGSLK